jgi:hypothetical protein
MHVSVTYGVYRPKFRMRPKVSIVTCSTTILGPVSIQKEPSPSSKLEERIPKDTKEMVKVLNAGTDVAVATWFKTARSRWIKNESQQIRRNSGQPWKRRRIPMEEEVVKVVAMEVAVVEDEGLTVSSGKTQDW